MNMSHVVEMTPEGLTRLNRQILCNSHDFLRSLVLTLLCLDSHYPSCERHMVKHLPDFIKSKMPLILRCILIYVPVGKKTCCQLTYKMPLTLKRILISDIKKMWEKICILELMKYGDFSIFFQYDFILTPQQGS